MTYITGLPDNINSKSRNVAYNTGIPKNYGMADTTDIAYNY